MLSPEFLFDNFRFEIPKFKKNNLSFIEYLFVGFFYDIV
ncbi:MAG: hypothetical protein BWX63_01705 [Bacteroidetes bacterium ADurb.Bin041]|nr:MAG: hypothetical protein BWX63_01705 [Bacteroidetes bacterium ADurb.Bin041]